MANIIKPYTIIEREGLRIAVLGLTTPSITHWLPLQAWQGMQMLDMVESARYWAERIAIDERPDMLVGLFHSGWEGGIEGENATRRIAETVPGFDFILYGHDHHAAIRRVRCTDGHEVLCVAPGSHSTSLAVIDVTVSKHYGDDEAQRNSASCVVNCKVSILPYPRVGDQEAAADKQKCLDWLATPICTLTDAICEAHSFFGPSAFTTLFHQVQLSATHADISLVSPAGYDSMVQAGALTMNDVFTLYRYNTLLYTMRLTGREILGVLEMSYSLWGNHMRTPHDHALLLDYVLDGGTRKGLKHLSLNMLSAAGIDYTVHLNRPPGHRVSAIQLSDGRAFSPTATYTVAINSYHGSGGGDMLTRGAGIPLEQLPSRIQSVHRRTSRESLIDYLRNSREYTPHILHNWSFQPEAWTADALGRDRRILFG